MKVCTACAYAASPGPAKTSWSRITTKSSSSARRSAGSSPKFSSHLRKLSSERTTYFPSVLISSATALPPWHLVETHGARTELRERRSRLGPPSLARGQLREPIDLFEP